MVMQKFEPMMIVLHGLLLTGHPMLHCKSCRFTGDPTLLLRLDTFAIAILDLCCTVCFCVPTRMDARCLIVLAACMLQGVLGGRGCDMLLCCSRLLLVLSFRSPGPLPTRVAFDATAAGICVVGIDCFRMKFMENRMPQRVNTSDLSNSAVAAAAARRGLRLLQGFDLRACLGRPGMGILSLP
jgi:hypothetical protein